MGRPVPTIESQERYEARFKGLLHAGRDRVGGSAECGLCGARTDVKELVLVDGMRVCLYCYEEK